MSVRIVFLGPLQDLAGATELEAEGPLSFDGLMDVLPRQIEEQVGLGKIHVACRGKLLADKALLDARDGDEIALLPPVSGG